MNYQFLCLLVFALAFIAGFALGIDPDKKSFKRGPLTELFETMIKRLPRLWR